MQVHEKGESAVVHVDMGTWSDFGKCFHMLRNIVAEQRCKKKEHSIAA